MAFDSTNFQKPQVDEVGQIILKAREMLSDPSKWFQGDYVCEETGAVCILGALGWRDNGERFLHGDDAEALADIALKRIARELDRIAPAMWLVPEFNDDPATTHADVLALLDRAAKAEG